MGYISQLTETEVIAVGPGFHILLLVDYIFILI